MELHAAIKYREVVEFQLESKEFLRVGGVPGADIAEPDLPVIKGADGKPFIPGSSIKGVIRAEYTRMLSSIPPQKLKEIIGIEKAVGKEEEIIELQKEKDTNSLLVEVEKSINGDKDAKLGVIDLLFGSHFFASPLLFTDAQVDNGAVKSRFHVSIDLDREVAKTGALVELEAVEPGSKFIGKMIYNSIDTGNSSQIDRAFEILKSTLNKTEIFIGGWRSRGYGLCEFSIINSKKYTPIDLISEKK
ncbi:hypothetical protein IC006_2313 [Sulfuracidifex tepidarius]|uniref:CRISPR type III-associated protein domain-containing protein n=2 Tax=Sulfuracidifex tepidarius TaxID=1294262 RepID=A0A510DXS7_9CREN|nr:CRISPR-associated RAMP protein Csx7 [Sulfuracidifex tepidarius]BBG24979.1 hypothetical protein IC006_2313 [Sulfuracidifex tepidarius]